MSNEVGVGRRRLRSLKKFVAHVNQEVPPHHHQLSKTSEGYSTCLIQTHLPPPHSISSFVELSDARDSKLLPCSCSASWKLHSIAIKVMWSSREEEQGHFKKRSDVFGNVWCVWKSQHSRTHHYLLAFRSQASPAWFFPISFLAVVLNSHWRWWWWWGGWPRRAAWPRPKYWLCDVAETADLIGCFSPETFREREKMEWHPTIVRWSCGIFTLDVTESISHGNNHLIWIGTPSRKGRFMIRLHPEITGLVKLNSYLVLQGLHLCCIWS